MKVSRLELATKYLIDLMRAYGHRPITVRVNMDGESVEIMARNFVKRQLTKVGILFPYTEANKANTLRLNSKLDNDMVSVIFHEALFEFEAAYVEESYKDSRRCIRTYPSCYRSIWSPYGYRRSTW